MTQEGLGSGQEPAEHLQEDAGQSEPKDGDKGFIEKAKDKLTGH